MAKLSVRDELMWPGISLRWIGDSKYCPKQAYPGDAGFDLVCSKTTKIKKYSFADVPCGIRIALPPNIWALITGRSSTLRNRKLLVAQGIIDNGWRGDMFVGVWNMNDKKTYVKEGERIAQLIPMWGLADRIFTSQELKFDELSETNRGPVRGEKGFGSTGM